MPLVELVGPPTVGKSTLVAACVRGGATDARRHVLLPRSPVLAPIAPAARAVAATDTGLRRRLLDRLVVAPDDARTERALLDVAEAWAPFLALVLDGPEARDGRAPGERSPERLALDLVGRGWLDAAIGLRALLEPSLGSPARLVLDEGLTHPFKAHAAVGEDPAALARYAELVPLPDVLVVLAADTDMLVARFRSRFGGTERRVRWAALGADVEDRTIRDELERTVDAVELVAVAAERRGCPVVRLRVDDATPGALAAELADRLSALPTGSSPEAAR